jgi:protein-S-isoprenylcysteine O-methyltransferase Ste14
MAGMREAFKKTPVALDNTLTGKSALSSTRNPLPVWITNRPFRSAMDLLIPPPVVVAILAAAMWLIDRAVDAARIDSGLQIPVAVALLIAGAFVMAMAVASFVAAKTTINPLKPTRASRLITGGVYRYSRNPIYLGDLLVLAATAAWLGQPANLALLAAFVWYIDRFQIRPEERALSTLFGAEYAAYCARVRRWL